MSNFDNPPIGHRRQPWWIALAGLAVLALLYSGLWFYLALAARDGVVQWAGQQRARGFAVRYDSLETAGFPFSIRLEFVNPGIGAPNAAQPWGWEGASLNLLLKPWDRDTIRVLTSGPQMLAFALAGRTETFTGVVTRAQADVTLSGGNPKNVRVSLNRVDLQPQTPGLGAIRIDDADFRVERLQPVGADHLTATASLAGTAEGVLLPWLKISPLGAEVQNLTIDGRLMGNLEDGPLIDSLENWRDSGGTIELRKLSLHHGPLKIRADGTLALDGQLQPIGAMTAQLEGFFETIDALQQLGMVKPRDAVTAKMVLGVLSRKPGNGRPATLNLALTIQGRRLYAGPIGLMDLPPVDWRTFRK